MTEAEKAISYEHTKFTSGCEVYIDESIRVQHPQSPLAGKYVRACVGRYYPQLEQIEGNTHTTEVPCFYEGNIYYVPEALVSSKSIDI